MKDLALFLLKSLVQNPEAIVLDERTEGEKIYLTTKLTPEDKGRVIGKDGCIIKAIRTVLNAAGLKHGKKVYLKIED